MDGTTAARADRAAIGRRGVHDRAGAVVGYEMLFSAGGDAGGEPGDVAVSRLMTTAFGEFGLHRLGPRRSLFVNLTRSFATGRLPMPFGPHGVVLELLGDLEVDAGLVDGVAALKRAGYRLAVDGYVGGPEHERLLPLVDVVKVDLAAVGAELAELVAYLRDELPRAVLLADGVGDAATFRTCSRLGFEYFEGAHFERAVRPASSQVSPSQMVSVRLLAALSDHDVTVDELERIVSADPGLSLRVLGAVNSASGAGQEVRSLHQAIVLLGRRSLSAWVMLAAIGGNPESRREEMIDVLARARICELLSRRYGGVDPSTAYAAGLLSGVVDVMGADPEQLVRGARLGAGLSTALLSHEGPVGALLDDVEAFDRTGKTPAAVPTADMSSAQLRALDTAMTTVDAILGAPPETPPAAADPGPAEDVTA
jgi:EAL and modified HD-GYP domain-containing signal transduction protein